MPHTSFSKILDGLSNTVFMGEQYYHINTNPGVVLNTDNQNEYSRCLGHGAVQDPVTGHWTYECGLRYSPGFEYNVSGGTLGTSWSHTFSASNHNGIALLLMGDGGVRSISYTVSMETLHALSTRNGGEVVREDY